VRLAYAFSRSVITQSGELGYINSNGSPVSVYEDGITDASGNVVQKRDTKSIAMLNQVSGEYRGKFFDNRLTLTAGVRAPFLHRELTNYCFTRTASASVTCAFGASGDAYAAANPTYGQPQTKTFNYSAVLPNAGVTFKLPGASELFANYSKGMSAPATTSLYQTFYPSISSASIVKPEKTDNFDLGYRYNTSRISAQLDLWYTHFTNRLGSISNPNDNTSVYTNLGSVNRYGFDGNVSYQIIPQHLSAYVFGSWLHSKIENNVYGVLADGSRARCRRRLNRPCRSTPWAAAFRAIWPRHAGHSGQAHRSALCERPEHALLSGGHQQRHHRLSGAGRRLYGGGSGRAGQSDGHRPERPLVLPAQRHQPVQQILCRRLHRHLQQPGQLDGHLHQRPDQLAARDHGYLLHGLLRPGRNRSGERALPQGSALSFAKSAACRLGARVMSKVR
jgi:outer membrane receptor protein involved in Fe transport